MGLPDTTKIKTPRASKHKSIIDKHFIDAVVGVHCFFNDIEKCALWFRTENPMFGNVSPEFLILCGRAEKVAKFVNAALDENSSISPKRTK